MTTFDAVLPLVTQVLHEHASGLPAIGPLLVNRDLNGRIRLIVEEARRTDPVVMAALTSICDQLQQRLGPHAYPATRAVLFESDMTAALDGATAFPLEGFEQVRVVDRLATESDWAHIAPESTGVPRVVFFSIKGGVGRSTALAATAWSTAQAGKRVLVLDLDLESPGLSSALLPAERRPTYGICDWLVEDLVDNGDAVFADMTGSSTLARDGEIWVVPAHGRDPGAYVSKLGRAWMPKMQTNGQRESWSQRLNRLIDALEARWQPDVILVDSRAGIDEIASSCVTGLGAPLVLLFALNGDQTWSGYRMLFQHWLNAGVAEEIRNRLQIVAAMVPELGAPEYVDELRELSFDLFTEELYDQIPPGEIIGERWNFDLDDEGASHAPWLIRWHRGFAALRSLHSRLETVDAQEVQAVFGHFLNGLNNFTGSEISPS
ncbi:KGGVGR-motif variant AAA ATPase [Leptothrix ochracea]|uniref:KGGVGR-motif variant AAA ATPase n=1 Tax=Leptothrix ochracea TaxID=735331 RepID=UPI0034E280E0